MIINNFKDLQIYNFKNQLKTLKKINKSKIRLQAIRNNKMFKFNKTKKRKYKIKQVIEALIQHNSVFLLKNC